MIKNFEYYSEMLNMVLDIEVYIEANKDESWVRSVDLYDETGDFISKKSLGPDELRDIMEKAETLADDYGHEAFEEKMEYSSPENDSPYDDAMKIINSSGHDYMITEEND